jgi:WD40 repeat protein
MADVQPVLFRWDANVVGAAINRADTAAVFALGDGTLRVLALDVNNLIEANGISLGQTVALSVAADCNPTGFLCSTDQGEVLSVEHTAPRTLARYAGKQVDQVAAHESGLRAVAADSQVHLFDAAGQARGSLGPHASTVAGVGFDKVGKRLYSCHYEGVSVWNVREPGAAAARLAFPGSHLAVSVSPDGKFVATATQEKEVHVWRTRDGGDMRMSGYYAKVRSMSWSFDSAWLVTSGGDTAAAWSFKHGGPEGKPPSMLGAFSDALVTCVACHPGMNVAALGYGDGRVLIAKLDAKAKSLDVLPAGGAAVSALAWSANGSFLLGGDKTGRGFVAPFV